MLVVTVHLLSDIDPVRNRLSEYVTGRGGPLMVAAFLAIGAGLIAVAALAWETGGAGPRRLLVSVAYGGAGAGMVIAGLVPTEPGVASTAEIVHSRASAAATLLVIAAALATAWWPNEEGSVRRRILAAALAILAVVSVALHETALSGLSQRTLWLVILAWLLSLPVVRA